MSFYFQLLVCNLKVRLLMGVSKRSSWVAMPNILRLRGKLYREVRLC